MGSSIFFFIESKTFEFLVEEGGKFYMLHIYERNRDSLCSMFMGRESAEHLLTTMEDVTSSANPGSFARTFRDDDKLFIMQLGANAYSNFVMISKLVHSCWKASSWCQKENWAVVGGGLDSTS